MDRTTTYPTPGATLRKYFRCSTCDEPFLTRRAVARHERKEHGQMSKAKHTPGEWVWDEPANWLGTAARVMVSDPYGLIATVQISGWKPKSMAIANARLIAAAPELIAALQGWQELRDSDGSDGRDAVEWIERVEKQMRNAIAKAQGGAS